MFLYDSSKLKSAIAEERANNETSLIASGKDWYVVTGNAGLITRLANDGAKVWRVK